TGPKPATPPRSWIPSIRPTASRSLRSRSTAHAPPPTFRPRTLRHPRATTRPDHPPRPPPPTTHQSQLGHNSRPGARVVSQLTVRGGRFEGRFEGGFGGDGSGAGRGAGQRRVVVP